MLFLISSGIEFQRDDPYVQCNYYKYYFLWCYVLRCIMCLWRYSEHISTPGLFSLMAKQLHYLEDNTSIIIFQVTKIQSI